MRFRYLKKHLKNKESFEASDFQKRFRIISKSTHAIMSRLWNKGFSDYIYFQVEIFTFKKHVLPIIMASPVPKKFYSKCWLT